MGHSGVDSRWTSFRMASRYRFTSASSILRPWGTIWQASTQKRPRAEMGSPTPWRMSSTRSLVRCLPTRRFFSMDSRISGAMPLMIPWSWAYSFWAEE